MITIKIESQLFSKRMFLLGLLTLATKMFLWSQPYISVVSYNNNKNGINNNICYLMQDRWGLMWFSTYDGLYKYDGSSFVCYKASIGNGSPLISNHIEYTCENINSDIWCLVKGKIFLFKRQQDCFVKIHSVWEHPIMGKWTINKIYNNRDKTFFVSNKGGVFYINDTDSTYTPHPILQEDLYSDFQWIETDNNNNYFISYFNQLVIVENESKSEINGNVLDMVVMNGYHILLFADGRIAYMDSTITSLNYIPNDYNIKRIDTYVKYNNVLLAIATDRGILILNTEGFTQKVLLKPQLGIVKMLYVDTLKQLWISDEKQIYKMDSITSELKNIRVLQDYKKHAKGYSFIEDKYNQTMWLYDKNCNNFLYYSITSNEFVPYTSNMSHLKKENHYIDKDGNLWIGSYEGIEKVSFKNNKFHHAWDEFEILCIYKDTNKNIWHTTRDGYIFVCDSSLNLIGYLGSDGYIKKNKTCFRHLVCNIVEDDKGNLWMAARRSGLIMLSKYNDIKYNVRTFRYEENNPYSLSVNNVYTLTKDNFGRIWVGGLYGTINLLQPLENGDYQFINSRNLWFKWRDKEPNSIRCFLQKDSVMIVGTDYGLFTFNCNFSNIQDIHFFRNTRDPYSHKTLSNNIVLCLLESSDKSIYVGTSGGGICRIASKDLLSDSLEFNVFTKENGLPSDIIYALSEDKQQRIWGFCDDNLFCLSPKESIIEPYSDYLNFTSCQFSIGNSLFMENGTLLKGCLKGLFYFNPEDLKKRRNNPNIYVSKITSMRGNKFLDEKKNGIVNINTSNDRDITISYSALDYDRENPIKYAYRMVGFDDSWKTHNGERSINYMNLPVGNYVFEVRSTNGDGIWANNTKRINLKVLPTFWETKWALCLYFIIILMILFVILFVYSRFYILRKKLKFEKIMTETKLNFFTDISHEIRTPLTLIDGPVCEILKDESLSDKSKEYLMVIKKNTQYLLNMIHHILDFRKIESQQLFLKIEPLELNRELNDIMGHFVNLATENNISFNLVSYTEQCILWVDKEMFERMVFNVLSNSFKYTPSNKKITIYLEYANNDIKISVKDEGCGIDKKHIPHLFKRFETIAKDNLFKPSSGLGLSMVKSLAEAHKAEIEIKSELEKGTIFNFYFKSGYSHFVGNQDVEINIPKDEVIYSIADSHNHNNKPTILVVEDNTQLRQFIANVFSPTYNILEASNGEEGFTMAQNSWCDLIICDVMMPKMDGFEMVRKIKEDHNLYLIPIILLTAKSNMDDRIKGTELGADDYIVKPFSTSYLEIKISALLKQRENIRQQIKELVEKEGRKAHFPAIHEMGQLKSNDEKFIQEFMTLLEDKFSDSNLSIEYFADTMNISRSLFNRKIKMILGCTPIDLIIKKRINLAIELLSKERFNISEIAYKCGFNDPKYFSKLFKKMVGKTPTEFSNAESTEAAKIQRL